MEHNALLEIRNLHAALESGQEILSGLNLNINPGETHVIMGPNGAGKSTLAHVIMGHPAYEVTEGDIFFEGEDLSDESTDERARRGIFLSFQTPEEVDGISVENFLRTAKTAVSGGQIKFFAFRKELSQHMDTLGFDPSYAERYLNVGFSGGEKKKSEILQMLTLNPKLAILDETDSGLDVDAVKTVTNGVNSFKNEKNALIIISHSAALLERLEVDKVHILAAGKIVHTGDHTLMGDVIRNGFHQFAVSGLEV